MTGNHYNHIQTGDNPLKIEKDLIELQKTIIYNGEIIRLEMDNLCTLVPTIIQKDKVKEEKDIIEKQEKVEVNKTVIGQDYLLQHLSKLELPKE